MPLSCSNLEEGDSLLPGPLRGFLGQALCLDRGWQVPTSGPERVYKQIGEKIDAPSGTEPRQQQYLQESSKP
jgi:hypothetical protein